MVSGYVQAQVCGKWPIRILHPSVLNNDLNLCPLFVTVSAFSLQIPISKLDFIMSLHQGIVPIDHFGWLMRQVWGYG
jgi:hypothetical protein